MASDIHLILMDKNKNRPVFLNLFKIRMPIMALVSIAHRFSGILLTLLIPAAIYLFTTSLNSEVGYQYVLALFDNNIIRGVFVFLVWALALHFFAGLRFLFIDLDIGVIKPRARQSAWLVQGAALLCALLAVGLVL